MRDLPTLNSLLAFVTVVREGSVSAAADVLNLTQPAISHQIKRLSEDTGLTLFKRSSSGLQLTSEGANLVTLAERTLNAAADFQRSARKHVGRVSGKLRIGTIVDPEFIRLGQLLKTLNQNYPDIATELRHGVSGDTIERIRRNQLDAGFYLSKPEDIASEHPKLGGDLSAIKLADFSYRVVGPVGWQKSIETASWEELAALPWIGTPENSVHHRLLKTVFAEHDCTQNVVALVDQESSMMEMVHSGIGLCLSRESIALNQKQSAGIALCETVSLSACLSFITPSQRAEGPVIAALLRVIRGLWQQAL